MCIFLHFPRIHLTNSDGHAKLKETGSELMENCVPIISEIIDARWCV